MLTRALFALSLICGMASAAAAEQAAVLALGLADHEVTEGEAAGGEALRAPRFNSPGVAYALVEGLKKGDVVEIVLLKDDKPLMQSSETLAEDRERLLLQAGKSGVPTGGWPEGNYRAALKVTRDDKTLIEQSSAPIAFE
jgi:hypothetical protein